MGAHETKTFMSGNSVALRLPKGVAYPVDTQVTIERTGDVLTIRPVVDAAAAKDELIKLVADLKAIGRPGEIEAREPIEFPDRPGLY